MRRFILIRRVDHSGISGTGAVAEGIQATNGQVALFWTVGVQSVAIFNSMQEMIAVHGHGHDTSVTWLD